MTPENCKFNLPSERRILSFKEAAAYLGYVESYMYKLTSAGKIPFSKPNGGRIIFDRVKLDEWLLSNYSSSNHEKDIAAATYVTTNPR